MNPRIINGSPESEMLVWTEECLVLPPEFRATLLRDAEIHRIQIVGHIVGYKTNITIDMPRKLVI